MIFITKVAEFLKRFAPSHTHELPATSFLPDIYQRAIQLLNSSLFNFQPHPIQPIRFLGMILTFDPQSEKFSLCPTKNPPQNLEQTLEKVAKALDISLPRRESHPSHLTSSPNDGFMPIQEAPIQITPACKARLLNYIQLSLYASFLPSLSASDLEIFHTLMAAPIDGKHPSSAFFYKFLHQYQNRLSCFQRGHLWITHFFLFKIPLMEFILEKYSEPICANIQSKLQNRNERERLSLTAAEWLHQLLKELSEPENSLPKIAKTPKPQQFWKERGEKLLEKLPLLPFYNSFLERQMNSWFRHILKQYAVLPLLKHIDFSLQTLSSRTILQTHTLNALSTDVSKQIAEIFYTTYVPGAEWLPANNWLLQGMESNIASRFTPFLNELQAELKSSHACPPKDSLALTNITEALATSGSELLQEYFPFHLQPRAQQWLKQGISSVVKPLVFTTCQRMFSHIDTEASSLQEYRKRYLLDQLLKLISQSGLPPTHTPSNIPTGTLQEIAKTLLQAHKLSEPVIPLHAQLLIEGLLDHFFSWIECSDYMGQNIQKCVEVFDAFLYPRQSAPKSQDTEYEKPLQKAIRPSISAKLEQLHKDPPDETHLLGRKLFTRMQQETRWLTKAAQRLKGKAPLLLSADLKKFVRRIAIWHRAPFFYQELEKVDRVYYQHVRARFLPVQSCIVQIMETLSKITDTVSEETQGLQEISPPDRITLIKQLDELLACDSKMDKKHQRLLNVSPATLKITTSQEEHSREISLIQERLINAYTTTISSIFLTMYKQNEDRLVPSLYESAVKAWL